MKDSTRQLMLNAEETLNAAEVLFREEYLRDAMNRAYYAVFYVAEALLNQRGLSRVCRDVPPDMAAVALPPASSATTGGTFPLKTGEPERDLRYSKHGAVHGAFAQHYVKTKLFDEKYHKLLTGAFRRRMLGDYDEVAQFKSDEVRETITESWQFVQAAKEYLSTQP